MAGGGTPDLCAAAARCHSAGSMQNAAANIILRSCTGVRRPEGRWRAQPAAAGRPKGSKGGRLPPPLVPRAKRNKMQDSSMEEGENKTEESGHLVSVLQLFFMYFIVLYLFGLIIYYHLCIIALYLFVLVIYYYL